MPSSSIKTVRISFNKVHLGDIITAFSPSKLLSELSEGESAICSVIFNKVSRLVQIDTKLLILPMKFLDDLDLKKSAFLTKNYFVNHKTQLKNDGSTCVHYLIKKRH